eukprot:gene26926-33108_t
MSTILLTTKTENGRSDSCAFWFSLESEEQWRLPVLSPELIINPTSLLVSRSAEESRTRYFRVRVALMLYWLVWSILVILHTTDVVELPKPVNHFEAAKFHWLLYLTNWTLVLEAVYLTSHVALVRSPKNTRLQRFVWSARNVVCSSSLLVAVTYWFLIFDGGDTSAVDIHIHLVNALIMLSDLAICKIPLYMKHFYFPFVYSLIYGLFNSIYVGSGGENEK